MRRRLHHAVLSEPASRDLDELMAYVQRDSPENAARVVEAVAKAIERLRRYPRSGPLDPGAPTLPQPTEVRRVTVSGFVVRYAFPFKRAGDPDAVYIASIRRVGRVPEKNTEFLRRFLQEAAGIYRREPQLASPSGR